MSRQHGPPTGRPIGHSLQNSGAKRHVYSCLPHCSSRQLCLFASDRTFGSCRRANRANQASRGRRLGGKTEAKAAARACCRAGTGGTVTPAAQLNAKADAFDQSRSNLYTTIGTTSATHHPVDHPGASRRRQPAGGENPVAGPGGVAGLRRKRASSRAQRSRQRAVSHQWRDAARWPDRLRQHSRRQLDRQYRLGRRARCRPNTACERSASSISRPAPTFSTTAVKSAFTAAVKERSRRRSNTAARSAAPVRRQLRLPEPALCPVRIAFPASSTSSSGVTCKPRKALKIRSPPTARSTTSRNRRKASPICRRSSTPIRGSA